MDNFQKHDEMLNEVLITISLPLFYCLYQLIMKAFGL